MDESGGALHPLFFARMPMTRGGENKGRGESSFRGRISARKIDRFPAEKGKGESRFEAQLRSKVRLSTPLNEEAFLRSWIKLAMLLPRYTATKCIKKVSFPRKVFRRYRFICQSEGQFYLLSGLIKKNEYLESLCFLEYF